MCSNNTTIPKTCSIDTTSLELFGDTLVHTCINVLV